MTSDPFDFNESPELRSLLEEKFGKYLNEEEVPDDLKDEVFNSINSLVMIGELADLFTIKFAQTKLNYISPFDSERAHNKSDNE